MDPIVLMTWFLVLSFVGSLPAPKASGFKIDHLDHLVITVADVTRTMDFYTTVLGMERPHEWSHSLYFGKSKINVHVVGGGGNPKPVSPTPGSADICLITDTHLDQVIDHLHTHNVSVLEGPVWRPGAIGSIRSVYFLDPDGNLVEIANYS